MSAKGPHLGRILAIFLGVVAVASTVVGWRALKGRPTPTLITDLVNVDGQYAVIIRDVEDTPERSFISFFYASEGERWGALIPRYSARDSQHTAVAATAEMVAVRTIIEGRPAIIAFDARHGRKLGSVFPLNDRRAPDDATDAFVLPASHTLADGGEALELFGEAGSPATAASFNLTKGIVEWAAQTSPGAIVRARLRPGYYLLERERDIELLERDTGKGTTLATGGPVCATGDTLYRASGATLIALPLDDAGAAGTRADASQAMSLVGPCGTRDGALVLALRRENGAGSVVALELGDLARAVVRERWRAELDLAWASDPVLQRLPDRAPLSGDLSRFVPILLGNGSATTLAMLDTSDGSIVWQIPSRPSLDGAWLMKAPGRSYLYEPQTALLASFGADTGELEAAVSIAGYGPVRPRHISGETIWLIRGTEYTVLDAASLQYLTGTSQSSSEQPSLGDARSQLTDLIQRTR